MTIDSLLAVSSATADQRQCALRTFTQQLADDRRLGGHYRELDLGWVGRTVAPLFPIKQNASCNADAAGKDALRQAGAGADRGDIDVGHLYLMCVGAGFAVVGNRQRLSQSLLDTVQSGRRLYL